jgi:hypothetical protein
LRCPVSKVILAVIDSIEHVSGLGALRTDGKTILCKSDRVLKYLFER